MTGRLARQHQRRSTRTERGAARQTREPVAVLSRPEPRSCIEEGDLEAVKDRRGAAAAGGGRHRSSRVEDGSVGGRADDKGPRLRRVRDARSAVWDRRERARRRGSRTRRRPGWCLAMSTGSPPLARPNQECSCRRGPPFLSLIPFPGSWSRSIRVPRHAILLFVPACSCTLPPSHFLSLDPGATTPAGLGLLPSFDLA